MQKTEKTTKHAAHSKPHFSCASDAVARLVRFGATVAPNGNIYIEKRVGLKVLGAVDYLNNVCHGKPTAIFGRAPEKAAK